MAAYLDITANSYSRIERGEVKCDLPKLFIICQLVLETANLIEIEFSEYCREKGVYPEQVKGRRECCSHT